MFGAEDEALAEVYVSDCVDHIERK